MERQPERKRIGEFLLEKGLINQAQHEEILRYSQETGLRFGDAGLALKFYTRAKLTRIFGADVENDFFYLDPKFFPVVTKDLFTDEQVLRMGALPLGFKTQRGLFQTKRYLNLGLLDPRRREVLGEAEAAFRAKFGKKVIGGIKVFLILADQYLEVVRDVYGVTPSKLEAMKTSQLDPVLAMYLERENS